jgi:hypothetical protein
MPFPDPRSRRPAPGPPAPGTPGATESEISRGPVPPRPGPGTHPMDSNSPPGAVRIAPESIADPAPGETSSGPATLTDSPNSMRRASPRTSRREPRAHDPRERPRWRSLRIQRSIGASRGPTPRHEWDGGRRRNPGGGIRPLGAHATSHRRRVRLAAGTLAGQAADPGDWFGTRRKGVTECGEPAPVETAILGQRRITRTMTDARGGGRGRGHAHVPRLILPPQPPRQPPRQPPPPATVV